MKSYNIVSEMKQCEINFWFFFSALFLAFLALSISNDVWVSEIINVMQYGNFLYTLESIYIVY